MRAITIGIPFFNNEATLSNAIRSVFAQTHQEWELLLVDDGSSDASLDIARSVKDPRVHVVSDGSNQGLPLRLNQIVRDAGFDLIGRMDADDMMSPDRFTRQLQLMSDPTVQIVSSGMAMLSADNRFVGYRGGFAEISMRLLLRGLGIAHAPLLGRRSWFAQNPYDPNCPRSQDAELWCRTYHQGSLRAENVRFIDEPLYFCREEDRITLDKVIASHRVLRAQIRKYGPGALGYPVAIAELLRSHLRSGVVRAASLFGTLTVATTLVRNRGTSAIGIPKRVQTDIAKIMSTRIPGLD